MEYMSTLQNEFDDQKPSLFELLSEHQLSALLPPSLRYLLAIATHRHPRYLLRLLNSFDELYALLSLAIEHHYLRTHSASFTENFYSLKRERVLRTKGGEIPRAALGAPAVVRDTLKLRSRDVWLNLIGIVGLPYLKRKLDEGFDIHAAPEASLLRNNQINNNTTGPRFRDEESFSSQPTLRKKLLFCYKWFLRNVYPSVNAAWYFTLLAFQLSYLFDGTKYSSPFLWLVGTRMRRMTGADFAAVAQAEEARKAAAAARNNSVGRPGEGMLGLLRPRTLGPRVMGSLRFLLPTSIFALKFLEWWHASDFSAQLTRKAAEGLDLPPPVAAAGLEERRRRQQQGIKSTTLPTGSPSKSSPKTKKETDTQTKKNIRKPSPPISSTSYLPILTVPVPSTSASLSSLCPICLSTITTPTATQTGHVYCYACIVKWIRGEHERQEVFMRGGVWDDDDDEDDADADDGGRNNEDGEGDVEEKDGAGRGSNADGKSRIGRWESGEGRDPISGRRLLGGTDGLRRIVV